MFKKITAAAVIVLMLASLLAIGVSAGAMNPADGCQTVFVFKKAAQGAVVHDGVISEGEYTEIDINRDSETTDLLISWDGPSDTVLKAFDFLQNVHFYASWDETNGINLAGKATLLEEPHCEGTDPVGTPDVPQDEHFMFQFGFMVKLENTEDVNVEKLYYSIGMNTVTGELLIGNYGRIGYVPCHPVAEKDYFVRIDGNTVTYEISFPASAVLPEESVSGGLPIVGSRIPLSLTLTGGSKGVNHNGNATYAVSIGDNGFMTSRKNIGNLSPAWGTVSDDPVAGSAVSDDTGDSSSEPVTEPISTEPGDQTDASSDPVGNETGEYGDESAVGGESENTTDPRTDSSGGPADPDDRTDPDPTDPSGQREEDPGKNDDGEDNEVSGVSDTDAGKTADTAADPSDQSGDSPDPDKNEGEDGEEGNDAAVDKDTEKAADPTAAGSVKPSKTGDPVIVLAAVASLSAVGAIIAGKKRR